MPDLRLGLASLQFSDSVEQTAHDVALALSRKPDVLGLTELSDRARRMAVRRVARRHGYTDWHLFDGRSDFAFLTSLPLLDAGRVAAHEGKPGGLAAGGYAARDVDWVKLELGGERIYVHGLHWVVPKTLRRQRDHVAASRTLIELAEKHATGRQLSFYMGDINVRDTPGDPAELLVPLQRAGMVSVWDELGLYPATHGVPGPIDVIGSMRRDVRVKALSVAVHRRGVHSDHHQVNATYRIAP